ncbi:MAG: polysaccharide deacetylase family protein [Beijerinckiaceae bacterium]|nr:MAG: polysaccharide deacetylase family protein [Beijerinckiaceae bacterium]
MPGKSPALKLIGPFFASLCVLSSLTLGAAPAAAGAACPAGTLGPERTLALGTKGGFAIGLKTYPQTLDLADHEVVLTFDDGPSPKTTPLVLNALAKQCVHATFFLIGRNAAAHPALVRREVADGETLGNHTFSHPARTLRLMSEKAAEADIEKGFAADEKAAYGGKTLAENPASEIRFFRFPGFADTPSLDAWLKAKNIGIFGADLWASDWRSMTPDEELKLVLERLEKERRGILLLHDTHRSTALMLPKLLVELKKRGFHIVRLVPDDGAPPKFRDAPKGWRSETEAILAKVLAHRQSAKFEKRNGTTVKRPQQPAAHS